MAAQKLETCNSKIKPVISLLLRHLTVKRKKKAETIQSVHVAEHSCTAQDAISRREGVNCPLFYQKGIPKKRNVVIRYTSFTYTGFSCLIIQAAISDATCQHF